jgi:hypothetical protein
METAGSVAGEVAVAVCPLAVEVKDNVSAVLGSNPTVVDVGLGDVKLEETSGFNANEVVGSTGPEGLAGVEGPVTVEGRIQGLR